jgi:transposase-like protein
LVEVRLGATLRSKAGGRTSFEVEARNVMQLLKALGETYPDADWQRCVVHYYRNIFSHVPNTKVRAVAAMLKAIHAQDASITV